MEPVEAERVFVDAKILGMHVKSLPKRAYVGYVVEKTGEHLEESVDAEQSDDAEIQAILFAIESLKGRFGRMTIVCDHQSVVSEANREEVKRPSSLHVRLRSALEDTSLGLEALQSKPAHNTLTEYVNRVAGESNP